MLSTAAHEQRVVLLHDVGTNRAAARSDIAAAPAGRTISLRGITQHFRATSHDHC